MAEETAIEKVMTAFEEFKSTNDARLKEIEKKGAADPLVSEKLGRIETDLAKLEDINQKLTAAALEVKKEKEHVDELEAKLNRLSLVGSSDPEKRKAELKTKVNTWARAVFDSSVLGQTNIRADQQKALADVVAEYKAMGSRFIERCGRGRAELNLGQWCHWLYLAPLILMLLLL